LTGTPTVPTATALTSTTQAASTAYADTATGVEKTRAQAAEALLAPLASPALTGTPTAPTASAATNTTQVATTAFVGTATAAAANALNSATTVVNVAAATAPTSGQTLTATSGTAATWQTPSGGGSPPGLFPGVHPITGTIAETVPWNSSTTNTNTATTYLYLYPVALAAGQVISNISMFATTAGATYTHRWAALIRWNSGTPLQVAHTADQTTTAVAAITVYTLPLVTAYTAVSDSYFIGFSQSGSALASWLASTFNGGGGGYGMSTYSGWLRYYPSSVPGGGISGPGTDGTTTYTAPTGLQATALYMALS